MSTFIVHTTRKNGGGINVRRLFLSEYIQIHTIFILWQEQMEIYTDEMMLNVCIETICLLFLFDNTNWWKILMTK